MEVGTPAYRCQDFVCSHLPPTLVPILPAVAISYHLDNPKASFPVISHISSIW